MCKGIKLYYRLYTELSFFDIIIYYNSAVLFSDKVSLHWFFIVFTWIGRLPTKFTQLLDTAWIDH